MKISYQWLQTFFEDGALPPVEELERKLIFHAYEIEGVEEVGDDYVLDVDVLPNRSSDSLSHRGIAREVATLFSVPMRRDVFVDGVQLEPKSDELVLAVEDDQVCPIHTLAHITDVSVGPSPEWLAKRIEAIGQKSINNVVDATNYVMYETGQPTHAFDADKLTTKDGSRGIRVRPAQEAEAITLLDGSERVLDESTHVLADYHTDEALDVAGVKGGVHAELTNDTVNVVISAAKFNPVSIRKAAQKIKTRTDAVTRFENEVPDQLPAIGMRSVVDLILQIAGGSLQGFALAGEETHVNPPVTVTISEIETLLGARIEVAEVAAILDRLGFAHTNEEEVFTVTAPWERLDIRIKEDVIEEIGRVHGYAHVVPKALPEISEQPPILKKFAIAQKIRKVLVAAGFIETYLYALRGTGVVQLSNALASDKGHLRESLSEGLVESLDTNEHYMPVVGAYTALRLFEVGNVFSGDRETTNMAFAIRVAGKKKREERTREALVAAKELLEKTLGVTFPDPQGETLECILDDLADQVDVDAYDYVGSVRAGTQFVPFSEYPFVLRDIAVWVPEETSPDAVTELVAEYGTDLLMRTDQFDTFTKDGKTSYAFHLVFQSHDKTLTDDEVNAIMKTIEEAMAAKGWEVR